MDYNTEVLKSEIKTEIYFTLIIIVFIIIGIIAVYYLGFLHGQLK